MVKRDDKIRGPDEFINSIRPRGCEILVTERGSFEARGVMIDIDRLYLRRRGGCAGSPSRGGYAQAIGRPNLSPSVFWNGAEIGVENLALFGPGRYSSRLRSSTAWGSMSLAAEEMKSVFTSYFGSSPKENSGGWWSRRHPHCPGALMHLRSLHAAASKMVEASPKLAIPIGIHTRVGAVADSGDAGLH